MTTVDFDGDFQTIAGQTGDIIGNPVERNRAVSAVSRYCLRPKCFVTEGWSLYWDLLLWDMQYQKTPAERIGVVFWHMHHRARLIF